MRPQANPDQSAPIRVGRYMLSQPIGSGGMGIVYRAYDPRLKRHVAVKLLRPESSPNQTRLLREAQAMAQLSSPLVVQVYDAGIENGHVFIAMELVSGMTLAQWLAHEPRGWEEVLERFLAAGYGLAAAHSAGLVHRDFKPGNVLLSEDGRVLVGDFGLARPLGLARHNTCSGAPAMTGGRNESETMTLEGPVQGTPKYMAPEQLWTATVDARADQYSFCVALTEALSLSGAPQRLFEVALRGRADDAEARFPTMIDLLHGLESARRPIRIPKRRNSARLAVVAAAAVAMVAGWSVTASNSATEPTTEPTTGPTTTRSLSDESHVRADTIEESPNSNGRYDVAEPENVRRKIGDNPTGAAQADRALQREQRRAKRKSKRQRERIQKKKKKKKKKKAHRETAKDGATGEPGSVERRPPVGSDEIIRDLWGAP